MRRPWPEYAPRQSQNAIWTSLGLYGPLPRSCYHSEMRNWKQIAAAGRFGIPEDELDRIVPVLDALEAGFRPLVKRIPVETEPATVLPGGPGEQR